MAFSIYDIIRMACLSINKPTMQQTSQTNDFVNTKSHAQEKPLLRVVKMKINFLVR